MGADMSERDEYRQQRDDYAAALTWVAGLVATTPSELMTRPTPCEGWDVRTLIGHLVGTVRRGRGTALGRGTFPDPHVVVDVPDAQLRPELDQVGGQAVTAFDRLAADAPVRAPWGETSALEAVRGFTVETVTHGWDLATATGAPPDAPDGVAERCLAFASAVVPERLWGRMYDDPVAPDGLEGPTERLAMLLGHRREQGT